MNIFSSIALSSYRRIPAVLGFAFAWVQTCLFLTIQIYFSAAIIGYFLILGSWLLGVVWSLSYKKAPSLIYSLALSGLAYYFAHALVRLTPPSTTLIPLLCLATAIVAMPFGSLIKSAMTQNDNSRFLFWENNGFVLGLLASILLFMRYGVGALEWAPLIALAIGIATLIPTTSSIFSTLALAVVTIVSFHQPLAGTLTLVLFAMWLYSEKPIAHKARLQTNPTPTASASRFGKTILLLAGCNAFLLQYFIARSFASALRANELTLILTGAFYMSGYSIGYFLAPRLSQRWFTAGILLTLPLTLIVLTFAKPLASQMIVLGLGYWALGLLIFLATLATSSFYSLLLPRTLQTHNLNLVTGYTWDLFGALIGLGLMIGLGHWAPFALWPFSLLILGVIITLVLPRCRLTLGFAVLVIAGWYAVSQNQLNLAAAKDYYTTKGVKNPKVLFAGDSFYHGIDIVESYRDRKQTSRLSQQSYLNGIKYFETLYNEDGSINDAESSLSEFTYFLAELPAKTLSLKLGRPLDVLIMGGGSLTTIRRVGPYAQNITLVEIDPLVVESSMHYWKDTNRLQDFPQAKIVIDDVRHFLMTTPKHYDLIINDISAPYYLGTALLHSEDFYRIVQTHLNEHGVFSESTQARPRHGEVQSAALKILKGVDSVFDIYHLIDGKRPPRGSRGYLYASNHVAFNKSDLSNQMLIDNKLDGAAFFDENSTEYDLQKTKSFSLRNIETLLTRNFEMLKDRIQNAKPQKVSLLQKLSQFEITKIFSNALGSASALLFAILLIAIRFVETKWVSKQGSND